MKFNFIEYKNELIKSKYPFKLILSSILKYTRLCKFIIIKRKGYRVRFFPNTASQLLFIDKNYQSEPNKLLKQFLKKNDIFVDIGANIGIFSFIGSKIVGEKGKVYSFEPHPKTFKYFKKNCILNKFKNINSYQKAIFNKKTKIQFSDNKDDAINKIDKKGKIEIETNTLDNFLLNEKKIKFIKIDVEGFEKYVLSGATKVLKRTSFIYLEFISNNFFLIGEKEIEVINLLKKNFNLYEWKNNKIINFTYDKNKKYSTDLLCINKKITIK